MKKIIYVKKNKSINNLLNKKNSSLTTVGKSILSSLSIVSSHKININKPQLQFNKITKRETPINYDLINACKLAIFNSRKYLSNFKEIFKKKK